MSGANLHAVPWPRPQPGQEHSASSTCWCEPRLLFRDLASMAMVYIHRDTAEAPDDATTRRTPR